nr:copia protein [Tanacetum cinerariifolium]
MMGKISFFLGLQISQSPRGIFINQLKYALKSLKKYGFESYDPVDTPMVEKSKLNEDKEGKAIDPSYYRAFADADHAGCQDTCCSTSGSLQFLRDRLITWSSKRQKSVAISSTEDEYITLSSCCAQILWMRSQITDYGLRFNKIPRTMDMTIDQQVALDEALVPHASRLRIGKSNFPLRSDITSKESTLQATATVHHHSICFKMNNKKRIVNLKYFSEMLHICPRIPNQRFDKLPFEEEILAFIRYLGHSGEIKKITDVNINKLHQPWRSFAAVINKCLSRKSTGYDSLRLSQAQILKGMYHKKNVDFAYLLWEDFVYQVEHKDAKKSNEMYYPRFIKVIINIFMTKDPSILKRNKVNWHYVRDDQMFTTIKLVSRHQNTQQFGAILHVELINEDIKNFVAYKEYYAIASGAAPPKTKASVRKMRSSSDTTMPPPIAASTRLSTSAKGKQPAKLSKAKDKGTGILPGVPDVPTNESNEEISWKSSDDDDDDVDDQSDADDDDDQEEEDDFDPIVQTPSQVENSDDESNNEESHGMNVGGDEGPDAEDDDEELYRHININLEVVPLLVTTPTLPPPSLPVMSRVQQAPTPTPTTAPSTSLQDLLNFSSLFGFDHRHKTLEGNFSEFMQTNQFDEAVSSIFGIVDRYIDHRMNEAVKVAVQLQNLYKALVDAYKCDKIILDTYGDTVTLKRRRDDADKDEEPFARSDRGSKRKREGKEPESISDPKEKASKTTRHKRQQFYGFAVNRESTRDVYLKHRIIAVTELQIVKWHNYKHLDWITVRKLTNLTVEERFAFNISLKMLTRSIVIQRRVEDLQLGVKSYQKKLNLTNSDTYMTDLKCKEADTAYSNPRGFIYQNKDKQNRLMRIDELHKFSDETLNDVRISLDDHLKGIRMKYLPQTIWRRSDKERAAAMIQAIDKQLKTRRIMRSLEKFVGGRLYKGDFRMLQRTI